MADAEMSATASLRLLQWLVRIFGAHTEGTEQGRPTETNGTLSVAAGEDDSLWINDWLRLVSPCPLQTCANSKLICWAPLRRDRE